MKKILLSLIAAAGVVVTTSGQDLITSHNINNRINDEIINNDKNISATPKVSGGRIDIGSIKQDTVVKLKYLGSEELNVDAMQYAIMMNEVADLVDTNITDDITLDYNFSVNLPDLENIGSNENISAYNDEIWFAETIVGIFGNAGSEFGKSLGLIFSVAWYGGTAINLFNNYRSGNKSFYFHSNLTWGSVNISYGSTIMLFFSIYDLAGDIAFDMLAASSVATGPLAIAIIVGVQLLKYIRSIFIGNFIPGSYNDLWNWNSSYSKAVRCGGWYKMWIQWNWFSTSIRNDRGAHC